MRRELGRRDAFLLHRSGEPSTYDFFLDRNDGALSLIGRRFRRNFVALPVDGLRIEMSP